ncbi:MAG: DUF4340 domain-containing protein [Chitinivibrionia bacterium]|nr:DUF4340 domain-containing protein [Chitinivibrionia bacterium]
MRLKNTWIMLAVAAALLAFFFLFEQPGHKEKLEREASEQKLTNLSKDGIARLTIETPGRPPIVIEKTDGTWMIRSPVSDAADEATVNTLVASIADAAIERTLEPDSAAANELGLDRAATKLVCATAGNDTTLSLTIGGHTLTKSHFYARKDAAAEVLLLPATIRRYAVKELPEFRDKKILDFMVEDASAFELSSGTRTLRWDLLPGNGWIAVQGRDTIRGDAVEVESILRKLRALRVKSFVSDDPADFAQYWTGPKNAITVWTESGVRRLTLRCGALQEGEFSALAEGSGRIVKADGAFLGVFASTAERLRDRHLVSFDRNDVLKIEVQTPDTSGTIVRSGEEWSFLNPALGTIEQQRVSAFFSQLEGFKCDSVLAGGNEDAAGRGFSSPSFSVTLFGEGDRIVDRVSAGAEDPGSRMLFVSSRSLRLHALVDQQRLNTLLAAFKNVAAK